MRGDKSAQVDPAGTPQSRVPACAKPPSPQHSPNRHAVSFIPFNTSYQFLSYYNTGEMSAIQEHGDTAEPVQVLVSLHDQMNLMDVAGPLEVMSKSLHNFSDPGRPSKPHRCHH